jgi:hypothetical protein
MKNSDKEYARIRCLNRASGTSVIASSIEGKEITWSDQVDTPVDVIAVVLERVKKLGLYS